MGTSTNRHGHTPTPHTCQCEKYRRIPSRGWIDQAKDSRQSIGQSIQFKGRDSALLVIASLNLEHGLFYFQSLSVKSMLLHFVAGIWRRMSGGRGGLCDPSWPWPCLARDDHTLWPRPDLSPGTRSVTWQRMKTFQSKSKDKTSSLKFKVKILVEIMNVSFLSKGALIF